MNIGDLQVWWIPQVPMVRFTVNVRNLREARLILYTLAMYDLFLFIHHVRPDYTNAGGLSVWSDDSESNGEPCSGWVDWYDDEGRAFDEIQEDELDTARWEGEVCRWE